MVSSRRPILNVTRPCIAHQPETAIASASTTAAHEFAPLETLAAAWATSLGAAPDASDAYTVTIVIAAMVAGKKSKTSLQRV
jgi:hypothetical protein